MNDVTYYLSNDCFVCRAQSYWIVLNARRDRYLCVAHADLSSIGLRLHGWSDQGVAAGQTPQYRPERVALVESLISSGIITRNPAEGKPFKESECPARKSSIDVSEYAATARPSVFFVARFVLACVRTDWDLRTKEISRVLRRIGGRRRGFVLSTAIHDVTHVSRLIAIFKGLRPLYPRSYLCLFDSLALLEFLASCGLFPQVVFGVIADPFQAHCWLQAGSLVLNDDLERVGKFTPILNI
jgi:hypothetical protein